MSYDEDSHEVAIERALVAALTDQNLAGLLQDGGYEPLLCPVDGGEVDIRTVRTLSDAMFLTNDRGVVIALDDGSEFTVSVSRYRNPTH